MSRSFAGFGGQPVDAVSRERADLPAPRGQTPESRRALLIGNGRYPGKRLQNPVADVRLIASALGQIGFDVLTVEDADLAGMRQALADFAIELERTDPETVALVYYAGHGIQWRGINYLIPCRADIPEPRYLPARALALDEVMSQLGRSPRRANIVIVDACRDNPLADMVEDERSFNGGLAALSMPPAGMLVAYSTAAGRIADDGSGANSPYAKILAQTLGGLLEEGRRIHDVFVETADRVSEATGGRQNPALFLQGALPPLTLSPEDAGRRARYDPSPRRRDVKVAAFTAAAVILAFAVAGSAFLWQRLYPEDRSYWLSLTGLAADPNAGLSCRHPRDDRRDAYGLTPQEWCVLDPGELARRAERTKDLASIIREGLARGEAKALFLRAAINVSPDIASPEGLDAPVGGDLQRAQRAGLPVAAFLAEGLAAAGDKGVALRGALTKAAADGHLLSRAALARQAIAQKIDTDVNIARLETLRSNDPTGMVAGMLADVYSGKVNDQIEDASKGLSLTWEAARRGQAGAILDLISLAERDRISIDPVEKTAFRKRLSEVGEPSEMLRRAELLASSYRVKDNQEASQILTFLAKRRGEFRAGVVLARLKLERPEKDRPDETAAILADLEPALTRRDPAALTLRARLRAGLLKRYDGSLFMPIDPTGAYSDVMAAAATDDTDGLLLKARFELDGIGTEPDIGAAKVTLERMLRDPRWQKDRRVLALNSAIDIMLSIMGSKADIFWTSSERPVSLNVIFDPACTDCEAATIGRALDIILSTYVQYGFVNIKLRPVARDDAGLSLLSGLACLDTRRRWEEEWKLLTLGQPLNGISFKSPCSNNDNTIASYQNMLRMGVLENAIFAKGAPIAPVELPDRTPAAFGVTQRARALPVVVVNGWIVETNTPDAIEETVHRLLTPSDQIRAREKAKEICASPDVDEADKAPRDIPASLTERVGLTSGLPQRDDGSGSAGDPPQAEPSTEAFDDPLLLHSHQALPKLEPQSNRNSGLNMFCNNPVP